MTELGIYLDWQKNLQGTAYNIPLLLPLPAGTDSDRLKEALTAVLKAHVNMLSHFSMESDGTVVRLLPDPDTARIDIQEFKGEPEKDQLIRPFSDPEGDLYRLAIIHGEDGDTLFTDFHHILVDGASVMVFLQELTRAYAGEEPAGETVSAADFAAKEQDARKTEAFAEAKRWYEELIQDPEIISNPAHDREEGSQKNACFTVPLTADKNKVREFVKGLGIRTGTFFTGVYGFLLSRFSGAEDALYATIHNGRTKDTAEDIGMFVKTFPVTERFSGEETIAAHLLKLDEQITGSRKAGLFSYIDVCSQFRLTVPTMFAYQGDMESETDFLGGKITPRIIQSDDPKEEVVAEVFREKGEYRLRVSYRTDLFEEESMKIFAGCYDKTVSEFLTRQTLGEIDIASEEQIALLDSFQPPLLDVEGLNDIVSMFRVQAEKHPDAPALIIGEEKRSYGEINDVSDRIAWYLRQKDIGRGKVVSILIHRNEYMVKASLGALKSGAGYQPLDPTYPPERLLFMVNDSEAALVIADEDLTSLIDGYTGEFLLTKDIPDLPSVPENAELPVPDSHDTFTLLYTSGSTGVPKGVILEHGNLANFCKWYRKEYDLTEGTVHAAYASYGFDANMMDLYPALTSGGCVCVVPEDIRLNLPALGKYLGDNNVSVAFMTTQVGRQFAASSYRPACLRSLSVGGEKLAPMAPPEGIEFYNVYGPTECTILATKKTVDREYLRIPIGHGVAGAALYVVDSKGRRVPPCVPGELWIAGRGVGRGYLNRPEKNAESFIANPFCSHEGYDRVYRTGDVVRFLPNGDVDFIGRSDGQVKIRGFRIELSEIESVIREYPAIEDVTVQAYDNESGSGKYVAAFIVVKEGETIAPGALEAFIKQRKPPYMVPSVIMEIDHIPLNQNQKVDKRKLPKPERAQTKEEGSGTREMTALEQELFEICSRAAGNKEFSVSTILTEAGLTSISTMQLMVELEEKFGYSPDVSELMQGMSILDIENALVARWRSSLQQKEVPAEKEELLSAPLTQTQLGIWLEYRMDETSDKYNIPFLLKIDRDTDVNRLADAIHAAVEAHPFMKSSIEPGKNGGAEMIAHPDLSWEVSLEESQLADAELEKELSEEPLVFKLSRAPLFRFRLIRTNTSLYLSMIFHHIIMDGTSVAVLMEDIEKAYQGEALTAESYTSLDLAMDERDKRATDALSKAKNVYDGIFGGVSVSSLPAAEKAPDKASAGKAASAEYILDGISAEAVADFCQKYSVTENALFTASFAMLLSRLSDSEEALFAAIYNGRTRVETLRIMGMLVKTYPIWISTERTQKSVDFILSVQKRIQELTANDLYSFAEAVKDYDVNADILFAYQGDSFTGFTLAGQKAVEIAQPFTDAKEPLSVDVWKKNGAYEIAFEYRKDMYTQDQMKWMADIFTMIAAGLMKEDCLRDIKLLSPKAGSFLNTVNDTDVPTPFRPVRCLMEENASKYPDRLAVVTPTNRLTYGELNESANRIAHALIDLGASGRIVSLMLPRSEQVYMVRQGILKAGAAFLSIAPDYPDDRVRVMAEEAESAVLVVTEELAEERKEFLASLACPVVAVEKLLCDSRTDNPDLPAKEDDLAYCIFTSGSTGKPKGVMLTQGNLFNFLDANEKNPEILGYTEKAHVSLALAAITFDVSVMEEFIPLSHGMTICMTTEEEIHNPAALAKFMTDNQVDMMTCTPSFLSNCIELSVMKEALKNVRSYDIGAEAFPAALYNKITALNPDAYIMNGYGPTEATISCTMDQMTDPGLVTIGRPASNVKAYIMDEQGNILPPLVPGELIIAGRGVGRGYVGRPDLTAEKFFIYEGRKAYRTGDVAEWTSDGRIRFRGRADNQVKLRGLRVELGEIESAINAVPGVITSIVVMAGEENNHFLAGYYTAGREIPPEELKAEIGKTLTPYMVPGVLMQLETMPLTKNGKIDKKKLPKVEFVPDEAEYVEPANEIEKNFCRWFAEVLSMEKVSATGNFFELGGTSLSASVIAINAAEEGYPIVYADVFKAQTPRMLAALAAGDAAPEAENKEIAEIRSFDYSKLPLAANTEERLTDIHPGAIGNLLLTGATGFLGIHVLREYLTQTDGTVYCLLRGSSPDKRLKQLYFYYFDEAADPYFENGRIRILQGDITDVDSLERAKEAAFDTLINCAALVKHFVKDDSLERINVEGVKNLIALCKATGRRLIQTSTVSVAGEGLDGRPPREWVLREDALFGGQLLDNAYALTKFKAEKAVLEAVSEGLDGKIMRLGNLMGRHSDGEFQVNFRSNAFIRSLASYKAIGAMPYSVLNAGTDFSEIDMTARAILLLSGTGKEFTVFHPVNNHSVTFADILYSMKEYGFPMDTLEDEEFGQRMEAAGDSAGALVAYNSREGAERRYMLDASTAFTTNALFRLGFKWPVSGERYIVQMIKALDELIMFEDD